MMQAQAWRGGAAIGFAMALLATIAALGCLGGDEAQDETPTGTAAGLTPTAAASATTSASPSPSSVAPSAGSTFSQAREVIERFVPQSSRFRLYLPAIEDPDRPSVDFVVFPEFTEGRLHIISFGDRGQTFLETYRGLELYTLDTTVWAKLVEGEPALWAGSPLAEAVKGFVDFYLSGEPRLTRQTFWDAFDYAEQRIGAVFGERISLLRIDFEDKWSQGDVQAGGIGIEATYGDRHAYLGVLYAPPGSSLDAATLVEARGSEFRREFAVPNVPTEETENEEWGYANHIWFAQWEGER